MFTGIFKGIAKHDVGVPPAFVDVVILKGIIERGGGTMLFN